MEEQVASIYAVSNGLMDDVPVEDIKRFESEMIEYLRASASPALKTIKETGALDDDTASALRGEIEAFKANQWKAATAAEASTAGAPAQAASAA
jgi:F-type H+-transporting ATPase subunit alpha